MYFLSDVNSADFAQKPEENPAEKKVGMLKKGFQFAVGKTPMGTLTRAASVAGIGGSLYGVSKMRKTPFQAQAQQMRNAYYRSKLGEKIKNAVTGNTAKGIGASAVGTVAGGLALNEGRKLYEKKNRKWWEVL
jgi:hypothetical protein